MFNFCSYGAVMEFLAIILIVVLITTVILPWVNHSKCSSLQDEVDRLNDQVADLARKLPVEAKPRTMEEVAAVKNEVRQDTEIKEEEMTENTPVYPPPFRSSEVKEVKAIAKLEVLYQEVPEADSSDVEKESKESKDWFGKVAVWVGGIALLMAGFYMVKYSINSGLLTPEIRVWATASFGVLLAVSGFVISRKSDAPGSHRVVQALTGAGVACLYFAVYAAVNLYGLMTPGAGFVGMIAVTAIAVALSLCHGVPIALMGFMGGFLTPMLMGDFSDDPVSLFVYLFLLLGAAQFLCAKRRWWGLFFGALVAAYTWSAGMLLSFVTHKNVYPEGILFFLLGVCALNVVLVLFMKAKDFECRFIPKVRFLTWGGGVLQTLLLVSSAGFEAPDMALFTLLSFGALVMAVFREKEFLWAAVLAFLAMLLGAVFNTTEASLWKYSVWPSVVALVFFGVSHFRALKSEYAIYWRALSIGSLIMTLLVVFINCEFLSEFSAPFEAFWLLLSVVVSSVVLVSAEHFNRAEGSDCLMFSSYSAAASFLIGFGLWDYLPLGDLSIGFAGLLLATAGYWKVRKLVRADLILGVIIIAWLLAMLSPIANALGYLFKLKFLNTSQLWWSDLGAWYVGLAVLSIVLHWFGGTLCKATNKVLRWTFGIVALLAFVATYRYLDLWVLSNWVSTQSVNGGLTALLAMLSLSSLQISRRRSGGLTASKFLITLVGYRIVVMHLLGAGADGDGFFFNALFWQFGVPFIAVFTMAWLGRVRGESKSTQVYQVVAMLLGFIWVTFLVQDYSGSARLYGSVDSNTELYTYSVVWLLLAVIYQAVGLWRGIRTLHIGSLLLLLLTVGKVFLVDASELEGLYRVLSFLGLGIALIGIGFFYNKVVFGRRQS